MQSHHHQHALFLGHYQAGGSRQVFGNHDEVRERVRSRDECVWICDGLLHAGFTKVDLEDEPEASAGRVVANDAA